MHPNRKFHIARRDEMEAVLRDFAFGTLVAATAQGLRAVHLPVLLEDGRLLFHVSRGNAVHPALLAGGEALFVAGGPHAYVSPDDYGTADRVPTWSYVAVEVNGPVRPLDEDALVRLLDSMSAEHERRLAPKPEWLRDRLSPGRFEGLLKSIGGFALEIAEWRGTAKIDQDKPPEVRARIAAALAARGEAAMAAFYVEPAAPGADYVPGVTRAPK